MKRDITRGCVALKAWREAQQPRVTQHQIAVALDAKSVFTISKWERGIQVPSVAEAVEIERFTAGGVPVAWWAEPALGERATERESVGTRHHIGDAPPPGDEDESELPTEAA